ncbi:5'-methylthioadenosine/S-adenosylhomocysteine nucleosidase [Mesoplasma entomophilum]|uniref:adenosylhomocysteine nucleosidase n=1 Tax=Mesoplasma entomophilum TaxID=2149 RepID=A0A3S5Y0C6_9MOLU|nr:5'-methylthioadenosine/S-adenosylhomocysteine nucleosidase [Mesoplasma entomophilum]ATQ35531.1 5'-methylthioadenosine/S-adenosylhomocysteine nucleosidase [Mesoplasma entomophilum]ATZ19493.1 5'-methylthioadenosine/S-adenosylhomocysteine nucleosidase [Mesoplasma entomophilum]
MKLIIGAMHEELQDSIAFYNLKKIDEEKFVIYKNEEIMFCITGVGLINSAAQLAYILTKYEIDSIINIGTSGGCDKSLKQGDIILVDKVYNSVADATVFGYAYGQVPRMPKYYETNKEKIMNKIDSAKIKNIASSDIFIHSIDQVNSLVKKIDDEISILDMECFAYAQTAYLFKKEFSVIKIVSDIIGKKDANNVQFNDFIKIAGKEILEILKKIL